MDPGRTYASYLILGYGAPAPLWTYMVWLDATRRLDPVLAHARGPAAMRSTQTDAAGHAVPFSRRDLAPERWTHGSPETADKAWTFVSAEIWGPHWDVCAREDVPPDVFMAIARPIMPGVGFDQALLLALHDHLQAKQEVAAFLADVARAMHAILAAQARLPWSREDLQDFLWEGLYTPGLGRPPEIQRLGGLWKPYLISDLRR